MRIVIIIFLLFICRMISAQALYIGPISSVGGNNPGPDLSRVPLFPIVGLSLTSGNIYSLLRKRNSEDLVGVSFLIGPAQLFYTSEAKNISGLNSKTINGVIGGSVLLSGSVKFIIDKKMKKKTQNSTSEYGK